MKGRERQGGCEGMDIEAVQRGGQNNRQMLLWYRTWHQSPLLWGKRGFLRRLPPFGLQA